MSERTRVFLTVLLFLTAVGVLTLATPPGCYSQEPLDKGIESGGITLELLQAEELDTVLLDRPVHFITPDVIDTVAVPEMYQVLAAGQDRLKLVPRQGRPTLIVEALLTSHAEAIEAPTALYVRDDEKFPHIVLLLPDGRVLTRLAPTIAAGRVAFGVFNSRRSRFRRRCRKRWSTRRSRTDRNNLADAHSI
jgi:hypothetical protein